MQYTFAQAPHWDARTRAETKKNEIRVPKLDPKRDPKNKPFLNPLLPCPNIT